MSPSNKRPAGKGGSPPLFHIARPRPALPEGDRWADMHASLPFQVTSEAESYIRDCLRPRPGMPRPGMQAVLFVAHGFEEHDEDGRLTARFEGDHFVIGYDGSGEVAQLPQFVIAESSISIDADTLGRLQGRTLTLQQLETSCEFSPDVFSKILITA